MDDAAETCQMVCQEAMLLARAAGAVLYLAEPGRLVAAGGAGVHPRREVLEVDPVVERAVRHGSLELGGAVMAVPVLGDGAVLGAVEVHHAAPMDPVTVDALHVFAHLSGSAFARFGGDVDEGSIDPVTGVGDHRRGAAALASVSAGDGVVVCELDGITALRRRDAAAADLAQGQFGLQLRNAVRPGDAVARSGEEAFLLVLRQLRAPVDVVVRRIVGDRPASVAGITVSVGAALHLDSVAPADTADLAARMMASARAAGAGQLHVAPVGR
jgi:GGDEF domain-containing protein